MVLPDDGGGQRRAPDPVQLGRRLPGRVCVEEEEDRRLYARAASTGCAREFTAVPVEEVGNKAIHNKGTAEAPHSADRGPLLGDRV